MAAVANEPAPEAAAWPPTLPPGARVYCPDCRAAQSAVLASKSDDDSCVDLLCGTCRLVIATLFDATAIIDPSLGDPRGH
jgi:hypothetical protein